MEEAERLFCMGCSSRRVVFVTKYMHRYYDGIEEAVELKKSVE